jgi:hypothetical protein
VALGTGLDELTEKNRCVVLLGEPGIGKSQEWQYQWEQLAGQLGQIFIDLGEINSEKILHHEVQAVADPNGGWPTPYTVAPAYDVTACLLNSRLPGDAHRQRELRFQSYEQATGAGSHSAIFTSYVWSLMR